MARLLAAALLTLSLTSPLYADKSEKGGKKLPSSFVTKPAVGTKASCAVTGEEFTISERTQFATYNGKQYVFCCADCKPDFEKNPAKFAK